MPSTVTTIKPNAQGTYDNWSSGGAYSKVTAVSDEDTATANLCQPDNETYHFEDIATPGGSLVDYVKVIGYFAADWDASWQLLLRLNGIDANSGPALGFGGAGG